MRIVLDYLAGEDGDVDLNLIAEELHRAMGAASYTPEAIVAHLVVAVFDDDDTFHRWEDGSAKLHELFRRLTEVFREPFPEGDVEPGFGE